MKQCECTDEAVSHKPNGCLEEGVRKYRRDGKEIWLCYDCILPGDEMIKGAEEK